MARTTIHDPLHVFDVQQLPLTQRLVNNAINTLQTLRFDLKYAKLFYCWHTNMASLLHEWQRSSFCFARLWKPVLQHLTVNVNYSLTHLHHSKSLTVLNAGNHFILEWLIFCVYVINRKWYNIGTGICCHLSSCWCFMIKDNFRNNAETHGEDVCCSSKEAENTSMG